MKATAGEKVFYAFNYLLLLIIGLSCLIPLVHIISLSLSDTHYIVSGLVTLYPIGWTTDAFLAFFKGTKVISSFQNSLIITIVGVVVSMTATILTAYPLSRRYFVSRRFFTLAMVFTMLFSGGLVPTYLLVKQLGLLNTFGALWLPVLISTYNVLVLRTSFENIPGEVEEAARIDGCNEWRLLLQVFLPLSMPVLATLTLFYGVGYWNTFMNVIIYMNSTDKYNLTVLVQQMIQSQTLLQEMVQTGEELQVVSESLKAAGILVLVIPMLIVYPFLQKYFIKGVMLGAIKG